MFAKAIKAFSSPRHGNISPGDKFEDTDHMIGQMAAAGFCEPVYEKKPLASGVLEAKPSQLSQAGRAPRKPTPVSPEPTAELLPLTDPTNSQPAKSTTDATAATSPDTTKKRKKAGRKSGQ
mgnify:FL=1